MVERKTRSIPLSRLGAEAVALLVKGAREVPTRSPYFRAFTKPKSLKTAINDFRTVVKTDIKKSQTQIGVDFYEGVVGDRHVQLLFNDYKHDGNPTILVFDTEHKGMNNRLFKIVYTGRAKS